MKWLFRTSGFFRDRTHFALPVYGGLCHASHIYTHDDAQQVISSAKADERFYPVCPVIATSTGKPFSGKTATALLQQVVFEILTQQIAWDNVVKGIVDMANADLTYHFHLSMFRKSLPTNDLCSSLESNIQNATIDKQDFIGWLVTEDEGERLPRTSAQSKLAIVGMSCRLPGGATDNEKFWQILEQGLDVSREIPADRFDIASHYDSTGKELNKSGTQYGCFIDEPGMFDAPFFNMSPKESQTVDPQMRLALVTAYEALEQSGFVANRTPSTKLERIGTFYGQAADDYREVNQGQEVSTYYIVSVSRVQNAVCSVLTFASLSLAAAVHSVLAGSTISSNSLDQAIASIPLAHLVLQLSKWHVRLFGAARPTLSSLGASMCSPIRMALQVSAVDTS